MARFEGPISPQGTKIEFSLAGGWTEIPEVRGITQAPTLEQVSIEVTRLADTDKVKIPSGCADNGQLVFGVNYIAQDPVHQELAALCSSKETVDVRITTASQDSSSDTARFSFQVCPLSFTFPSFEMETELVREFTGDVTGGITEASAASSGV